MQAEHNQHTQLPHPDHATGGLQWWTVDFAPFFWIDPAKAPPPMAGTKRKRGP
jgi:hypothetical protein